ncbi:PP2C family protein-serine/threonine phosphatase [Treponema sp.]|uniref:PP2C family protein-serine/threonine phosphatase n=1 Tax=Treponema sp. TaxID=166 RepID=UPI00388F6367
MSGVESEFIDAMEFTGEQEVVRNENGTENFAKDFSPKQIGSIAKYIEPVNGSATIDTLIEMFERNPDLRAVPVEEYDRVVGIIDRHTVEEATSTAFKRFMSRTIIEMTTKVSVIFQAKDYIEKTLGRISELNKKFGMVYFPVFDRRNFFGIVALDEFLDRMDEIRKQDLDKASQIQRSLFPSTDDLSKFQFGITCWNRMANTLGGDFYKTFKLGEFQSLICCCDVSGKNVAASLLTVAAISFFEARRKLPNISLDPVDILSEFDDYLQDVVPVGNFITGVFVYIDLKKHFFQVFNCGHTTTYLVYANSSKDDPRPKVASIEPKLPPFGMGSVKSNLENSKKEDTKPYLTLAAKKGIHLELYSDGLTDMVNEDGFRFEDQNAKNFFIDLYTKPTADVAKEIKYCVDNYIGNSMLPDDITVIDIRFDSMLFV